MAPSVASKFSETTARGWDCCRKGSSGLAVRLDAAATRSLGQPRFAVTPIQIAPIELTRDRAELRQLANVRTVGQQIIDIRRRGGRGVAATAAVKTHFSAQRGGPVGNQFRTSPASFTIWTLLARSPGGVDWCDSGLCGGGGVSSAEHRKALCFQRSSPSFPALATAWSDGFGRRGSGRRNEGCDPASGSFMAQVCATGAHRPASCGRNYSAYAENGAVTASIISLSTCARCCGTSRVRRARVDQRRAAVHRILRRSCWCGRGRALPLQPQRHLRDHAALEGELERTRALLAADSQVLVTWRAGDDRPEITGDSAIIAPTDTLARTSSRSMPGSTRRTPTTSARAVAALRMRGEAFAMPVTPRYPASRSPRTAA